MTCHSREVCYLSTLLDENASLLQHALTVLRDVDERIWTQPPPGLSEHRIGPQFRHVLEFYDCLLEGTASDLVDYDSRRRDNRIEASMSFAMGRIADLIRRLRCDAALRTERPLLVRMEDSRPGEDAWFPSSLGRELQSVRTHTIHHFALIAILFRAWGIEVDDRFGVAPSTLRFRPGREAA